MPNGVAVPHSEEVLRTLQDSISLHEALPPADAHSSTDGSISSKSCLPPAGLHADMVPRTSGGFRVDSVPAMVHAIGLVNDVLVWRCWLGSRSIGQRDDHLRMDG